MYKGNNQSLQAKHRLTMADHSSLTENQTEEDRYQNLKRAVRNLEDRIKLAANVEERRRLGNEKQAIQDQLQAIKANRPKMPRQIAEYFMEEAKRILPRGQFDTIVASAKHAFDEKSKAEAGAAS